jgi:hypothetical protein
MWLVTPTLFGWDADISTEEFVGAVKTRFPGASVRTDPPGREQWTRAEVILPSMAMIFLSADGPGISIEGGPSWEFIVGTAVWFRGLVPDSVRLLLSDPGLDHSMELHPGVDTRQVLAAWPPPE